MRKTLLLTTALVAGLALATPARAEPISTAIAAALGGGAVATAVAGFAVNTVASMALSALAASLTSKPRPPGMLIEWTARGGANSATFGLGRFATPGQFVCPPMSHGQSGKTPNAYFTQVIALADLQDHALSRVMLGGEYIPVGDTPHADYGLPLLGKYEGRAWIRYHDGTQTTADAMLLDKYADWPDRPWTADMIGTGVCYAVLTFQYDRELYQGAPPDAAFEMFGIPLYDPRKDGTVGGAGAHRWDNPATWETTQNPIVMIYNILRGIRFPDGSVWGGECDAEDLPLANWAAAMNVCDETVNLSGGGTQPRYRAGLEIRVAEDEPADIVDQLLKAASARIVEIGGVFKVRAGGPGLPVAFITDDDLLATSPQEFRPFPGLAASHNAIHATFPNPGQMWRAHDAAPVYNAAWELRDGGRRLVAEIDLPAVNYPLQVQRLMRAWIRDDQRWRRHDLNLGFYAAALEPLDCIEWSSEENGYVEKLFEIDQTTQDPVSLQTGIAIREVDPDDYDWSPDFELPDPVSPGGWEQPPVQAVPGWAVTGHTIVDGSSNARRPALRVSWDPTAMEDVRLLRVRVRLAGDAGNGWTVSVNDVERGEAIIADGILPDTSYEARGRLITDRPNDWSSWIGAVTPAVRFASVDIAEGGIARSNLAEAIRTEIEDAAQDALDAAEQALLAGEKADAVQEDVDGFKGAFVGMRAETAGGRIAGIRLTSWDDPDGTGGSVIQLDGDYVMAPGTLSVGNLLIHDGTGNLVIDGGTWRSGDGRGIPEGSAFEVVARGSVPGNAAANAPTPYILMAPTGHSSGTDFILLNDRLPVRDGDTFAWSMDIAGEGAGPNVRWNLRAQWYGADGTDSTNHNFEITTSVSWSTRTGTFTAPRDGELVVELCRVGNAANPQNGRGYITNIDIRKQVSGVVAITPGSVTADLVNAGSFQAAGLAVFGGALQSANYTPGSAGWRIQQDGAAEFNELIVRQDMIANGAVTRRAIISRWQDLTISGVGLANAVQVGQETEFYPAPYETIGVETSNPAMVTITLSAGSQGTAAGHITFALQRQNPETSEWMLQTSAGFSFPANWPGGYLITRIVGSVAHGSQLLPGGTWRVVAYLQSGSPNVSINSAVFTIEQVNK